MIKRERIGLGKPEWKILKKVDEVRVWQNASDGELAITDENNNIQEKGRDIISWKNYIVLGYYFTAGKVRIYKEV